MKLKSYKHFPCFEAEKLHKNTENIKLKVFTINWTIATRKGIKDLMKVHFNIYETTLAELIVWIRETDDIAEDIVKIEIL